MAKPTKRIALIIIVAAIGLSLAAFALDRAALSATYERKPNPEVSLLPTYELYQSKYPRTDVAFELDGYTLRGHVYGAKNDRGLIVFRHGMFSKHQDYLPIITALIDKGWRVMPSDAVRAMAKARSACRKAHATSWLPLISRAKTNWRMKCRLRSWAIAGAAMASRRRSKSYPMSAHA